MRSFIFAAAVLSALGLSTAALAKTPTVGVASVAIGDPTSRPPQADERVLRMGVDVFTNERITTDGDDRAHLLFVDGSAITIGPNSDLTIDRFVYDPAKREGDLKLNMTSGTLRFVGGALSKKKHVLINSPAATIGIRGGIMVVNIANNGATTVSFLFGHSATVTNKDGSQTATRPGSQISVRAGAAPSAPVLMPAGAMGKVLAALEGGSAKGNGSAGTPPGIANDQKLNKLVDQFATTTQGPQGGPPAHANGGNGNGNANGNANGGGNGNANTRRNLALHGVPAGHNYVKHLNNVAMSGGMAAPIGGNHFTPGNGNAFGNGGGAGNFSGFNGGGGVGNAGGNVGLGGQVATGNGMGLGGGFGIGGGNAGGNGNGNGNAGGNGNGNAGGNGGGNAGGNGGGRGR